MEKLNPYGIHTFLQPSVRLSQTIISPTIKDTNVKWIVVNNSGPTSLG